MSNSLTVLVFAILYLIASTAPVVAQIREPWVLQRAKVKKATYKVVVELKEAPTVPEEGTAFVVHVTGDEDNPTVYLATAAHVLLGGDATDVTRLTDVVSKVTVRRGNHRIWEIPLDQNHLMIPERWESTDRDFAVLVIDHFGERVDPINISRLLPKVAEKFEVFGIPRKGQDAQLVPCQVAGALGTRPRRMLPAVQCSTDHGMSGGAAFSLNGVFGIVHGADGEARELRLFSMAALMCPYAAQFVVDWPDCFRPQNESMSSVNAFREYPSPPPARPLGTAVLRATVNKETWVPIDPAVEAVRSENHDQRTSILGVHIEPQRHPYRARIQAGASERISSARFTCVSGACPWTQKVYERVREEKIAEGEFEAWGGPTTWILTADRERLDRVAHQTEQNFTLVEGRYLIIEVSSEAQAATLDVTLSDGIVRTIALGQSMQDGPLVLSHKVSDGNLIKYTYIVSMTGLPQ